ncbi:MAG: peptide chain release factor N(5)-glutamine methyltransferase [Lentisphaerae bacterium]|nr:peptide chain release factor N(5)-glutamine methyltransferase [Lentisphaerota bacterium]
MIAEHTLAAILAAVACRVRAAAPEEARLNCEWLLSRALGCARLELSARRDQRLTESQVRRIEEGALRLAAGEPLQYVLGEAEFMGRVFACDARALIPRPETEQLVARLLAETTLWQTEAPVIAEVGAGSGCIVISLALERPAGRYLATDTSPAALALARENAARHGVSARIHFIAGDLLSGATPNTTFQHSAECWNVVTAGSMSLDAVVSNPPYVRAADLPALAPTVRDYEPTEALLGGADGLCVIRPLIAQAFPALKPGGTLFLEIGCDQGQAVREIAHSAGFHDIQVHPDLAGKDRIMRARKSKK